MPGQIRLAVVQMPVTEDKEENLAKASEMIAQAVNRGAQMVVLPEIFNAPYIARLFPVYAEPYPGTSTTRLAQLAADYRVLLVAGSIPELDNESIYNTSFIFGPDGSLLGRHRKTHLFDIDIPDHITFRESDTLSAGKDLTLIRSGGLCFSVIICYDVRFPEYCRLAALHGAEMLVIPAAFNRTTGPLHWELLMRSRAVDNQIYVVAASPALNPTASYQAWGHSMVVDPWGKVLSQAGDEEEILVVDVDLSVIQEVRAQLPVLEQRRRDLYHLSWIDAKL